MRPVSDVRARIADRFRAFATDTDNDTLYVELAARLAEEPDAMAIVAEAPELQARPVLLFAVVHDLVLAGRAPELARCYPSAGGSPAGRDVAGAFARTLIDHRAAVVDGLRTRTTQTNEVGRCGALVLAHGEIAAATGRPLGVVELGASAGLNLWFDTYAYDFGTGTIGDSPLVVHTERRRGAPAPPAAIPTVGHRAGIDLAPLDPNDPGDARWLQACVWPDEVDRLATLRAALALAARRPMVVGRGDAVDEVGAALRAVPSHCAAVVVHSWMLTYVPRDRRPALVDALRDSASRRAEPIWWVTMEAAGVVPGLVPRPADGATPTVLGLSVVHPDTSVEHRWHVPAHPHGRWVGEP
ncbi:MAG: DUF2332 domain-containing protein [Acidimicrobiales bacterium]